MQNYPPQAYGEGSDLYPVQMIFQEGRQQESIQSNALKKRIEWLRGELRNMIWSRVQEMKESEPDVAEVMKEIDSLNEAIETYGHFIDEDAISQQKGLLLLQIRDKLKLDSIVKPIFQIQAKLRRSLKQILRQRKSEN